MLDLVTVGHFAFDLITSPSVISPKIALGGPPTYVSVTAAKLGAKVSVISKVGQDFTDRHAKWLESRGVDLSGLKKVGSTLTTRFHLTYTDGRRKLRLVNRAPSIYAQDIPDLQAKVFHVAPIANEIQPEIIRKLRRQAKILSLDPQGFVRAFNEKGNTRLKPWRATQTLRQVDIYKSSSYELGMVTQTRKLLQAMRKIQDCGVGIIIITQGVKGAALLTESRLYRIPAYKPKVFRDPTGAGDAFVGAFLAEYLRRKEPPWCACVGSAAASFVVEGVGAAVFGEKEEVYARAREIYEKGLKQLSI